MSQIRPSCVFCGNKKGILTGFSEKTLQKCTSILEIRQKNNLSLKRVKVPLRLNDFQKYHLKCYRRFTALPPKYRTAFETRQSGASSSERDAQPWDEDAGFEKIYIDVSSNCVKTEDTDASSSSTAGESDVFDTAVFCEEAYEAGGGGTTTEDISDAEDPTVQECIFCSKRRKKHRGREEQLQTCTTDKSIITLKRNVSEVGDLDLLRKINEQYSKAHIVYYHKFCRAYCRNTVNMQIAAQREKTQWHKSREIHKKAFEQVCSFVSEKIIQKQQCFLLSFLKSLFIDFAKNENIDVSADIGPYNLEKRLLETFPKKIAIVRMNTKKVVKPYTGVLVKNDLNTLEKQDILDRSILILRAQIRDRFRVPVRT